MIVHYQNKNGIERFISNVVHFQNIGNETFEALMKNGKTLMLRVGGIEGIYWKDEDETAQPSRLAAYEDTGLTPEQIKALTAYKDEQAGQIMRLEELAKDLYFAYINKDEDFPHSFETQAIEKYQALLGGKDDV